MGPCKKTSEHLVAKLFEKMYHPILRATVSVLISGIEENWYRSLYTQFCFETCEIWDFMSDDDDDHDEAHDEDNNDDVKNHDEDQKSFCFSYGLLWPTNIFFLSSILRTYKCETI